MPDPSYGLWPPSAGGDDAGSALPMCVAQFELSTGTEALISQLGSEVFSGVSSGGVGDYWLLIDPAFQAVLTDATALFLSAAIGGVAPRIVAMQPDLPGGYIACAITDGDGAPADLTLLWVTVFYDTEAPPT